MLGVVVFHATGRVGAPWWPGASGVDLFFVLSGFLMTTITTSDSRPAAFLRDRAWRIIPSYWLVTTVMVVGGLLRVFPRMTLVPDHVVASYLFLPMRTHSGEIVPLLVQGWTLNYEAAFYLAFAALLPLRRPALAIAIMGVLFVGAVAVGRALPSGRAALTFYTDPIILEFVLGCGLGLLAARPIDGLRWCGIMSLSIGVVWWGVSISPAAPFGRVAGCGFAFALILASAIAIERRGWWPTIPMLRRLGDSSYSIYLWHTLALSVVVHVGRRAGWSDSTIVIAGTIAGVAGGMAGYALLERPLGRWIARRRRSLRAPASGAPVPILRDSRGEVG